MWREAVQLRGVVVCENTGKLDTFANNYMCFEILHKCAWLTATNIVYNNYKGRHDKNGGVGSCTFQTFFIRKTAVLLKSPVYGHFWKIAPIFVILPENLNFAGIFARKLEFSPVFLLKMARMKK